MSTILLVVIGLLSLGVIIFVIKKSRSEGTEELPERLDKIIPDKIKEAEERLRKQTKTIDPVEEKGRRTHAIYAPQIEKVIKSFVKSAKLTIWQSLAKSGGYIIYGQYISVGEEEILADRTWVLGNDLYGVPGHGTVEFRIFIGLFGHQSCITISGGLTETWRQSSDSVGGDHRTFFSGEKDKLSLNDFSEEQLISKLRTCLLSTSEKLLTI